MFCGERSSQKLSGGEFLAKHAKQLCCAAGLRLVMVKPRIFSAPIIKLIGGWLHHAQFTTNMIIKHMAYVFDRPVGRGSP